MTANLNWVDYIIIGIFMFSILAGLIRGLVRELISVMTWVAAFIISGSFASSLAGQFTQSPQVKATMESAKTSMGINAATSVSVVSTAVCFIGIFIMILIVGSVINYFVSRAVDAGGISVGNRLMGGVFGIIRGFLINLVMIFIIQLSPLGQQPAWAQSQFVKAYRPVVDVLTIWVEPGMKSIKSLGGSLQKINIPSFNDLTSPLHQQHW